MALVGFYQREEWHETTRAPFWIPAEDVAVWYTTDPPALFFLPVWWRQSMKCVAAEYFIYREGI